MSPWTLLLVATGACLALQAVAFVVARRIGNYGLVDPCWALCLVLAAAIHGHFGAAPFPRRVAVTAVVALWGLRHAWLLLRHRVIGRPEEGRYVALRAVWSPRVFFGFFLAQGLLAALLSVPFLLAVGRTAPTAHPLEVAALGLFAVGFVGEAVADAQLSAWKRDPTRRGRTCRAGLWAWSRHPNYFFELVMWAAFALGATPAPWGALAWTAPALLALLIVFVTGVPPTEAQAVRSRGDDYRAYQREVSVLVPWPPRRARA
jgi:steroid 5-alpha reductase family enzyme